jgi:hypothetical protein
MASLSNRNCEECGAPKSYFFGVLRPKIGPNDTRPRCETCGKVLMNKVTTQQLQTELNNDPYFGAIIRGENDHHSKRRMSCGHVCARAPSNYTGNRCCSCTGFSGPCSNCIGRTTTRSAAEWYGPAYAKKVQTVLATLTGVDNSQWQCSPQQASDRQQRLENNTMVGYHQTGNAATLIISSKKLKPGSGGIAGGGIYLATNPNDTMHKAHNFGFLFKVKAKLGNVQKWSPNTIQTNFTFGQLAAQGYDSVLIPRPGGDEHVVYNEDQVELLEVCRLLVPANHTLGDHGTAVVAHNEWFTIKSLLNNKQAHKTFVAQSNSRDERTIKKCVAETRNLLYGGSPRGGSSQIGRMSGSGQWACPACTFINSHSNSNCSVCTTARGGRRSGGGSGGRRSGGGSDGRGGGSGGGRGGGHGGSGGGDRRRCKVLSCNENHSRHYCKICKNKDSTHRSSQCPSQRSQILQMLKFGTFDLQ